MYIYIYICINIYVYILGLESYNMGCGMTECSIRSSRLDNSCGMTVMNDLCEMTSCCESSRWAWMLSSHDLSRWDDLMLPRWDTNYLGEHESFQVMTYLGEMTWCCELSRRAWMLPSYMSDVTYSHVWHDSFILVTWLIHMSDVTQCSIKPSHLDNSFGMTHAAWLKKVGNVYNVSRDCLAQFCRINCLCDMVTNKGV